MLDLYDKVMREHSKSFLKIGKKQIPVIMLSAEESDAQLFSTAGSTVENPDKIDFPIVGLVRLPELQITDHSMTKRQMNYSAYHLIENGESTTVLNGMLCSLKYLAVVFSETRKVSEDLGTQFYFRLRNNKQVNTTIILPLRNKDKNFTAVSAEPEIILDPALSQVRVQQQEEAQFYKFKFTFTLQNCYIFDFATEDYLTLNWTVEGKLPEESAIRVKGSYNKFQL